MAKWRRHPFERRLTVLELLGLGKETVGLDRIAETSRRLVAACIERLRLGQAVEAVVDLDRVEMLGIESEPVLRRELFRVRVRASGLP
jgi:hypothetical protein